MRRATRGSRSFLLQTTLLLLCREYSLAGRLPLHQQSLETPCKRETRHTRPRYFMVSDSLLHSLSTFLPMHTSDSAPCFLQYVRLHTRLRTENNKRTRVVSEQTKRRDTRERTRKLSAAWSLSFHLIIQVRHGNDAAVKHERNRRRVIPRISSKNAFILDACMM